MRSLSLTTRSNENSHVAAASGSAISYRSAGWLSERNIVLREILHAKVPGIYCAFIAL